MITMDFETRSTCDLKKAGAYKYSQDINTEVLCLAYKIDDGPTKLWHPAFENYDILEAPRPKDLIDLIELGEIVEAHNAGFEYAIWHNTLMRDYPFFPEIPENNFRCSAAMASHFTLPRTLEGAAKALRLPIEKDMEGNKLMLKMCKPRKPTKTERKMYKELGLDVNEEIFYHESKEDLLRIFKYCEGDVETEYAVSQALKPLAGNELEYWLMDQRLNRRGIYCDKELVEKALTMAEVAIRKLNGELAEITNGKVLKATARAKLSDFCKSQGYPLENTQAIYVKEKLEDPEIPAKVAKVLQICLDVNKTSISKYKQMLKQICSDNRLRDNHMYYGADRTGRWSGKGFQPHNFVRGFTKDMEDACSDLLNFNDIESLELLHSNIMDYLSKLTRGALMATPGKILHVADFAAIEARVLLWLVEDERGLDIFRKGEDIYKDMASGIYNKDIKKITKDERFMGKQSILGLGYGMGVETFDDTCVKYGVENERKFYKKVVDIYRKEKFPKVSNFWGEVENAAISAVLEPGKTVEIYKVKFKMQGRCLFCKLPSGRCLTYYEPLVVKRLKWYFPAVAKTGKDSSIMVSTKIGVSEGIARGIAKKRATEASKRLLEKGIFGKDQTSSREVRTSTQLTLTYMSRFNTKWLREETYGGKLTENIVQAIARDLLAAAMLRIDKHPDYELLLTVHDEIITETDKNITDIKILEDLMVELPEWAKGCPIDAEGWVGLRYKKD